MAHRTIADSAVTAGKPATSLLMHAMWDNRRATDYYGSAIDVMLNPSTGHVHGTGTVPFTQNFEGQIRIVGAVSDTIPFRFGSSNPIYAAADYSVTVTPGYADFAAMVTLIQDAMRGAVDFGSPGRVPLEVIYDTTVGSKTRGFFVFRHTGPSTASDVLQLLFGTGTGWQQGIGPTIGFAKRDRKGGRAYAGDSSFVDGFLEESFSLGQGGLLHTGDFQSSAFTTAKFTNGIVTNQAFANGSISGGGAGNIADNAVKGEKIGVATIGAPVSIGAGATNTFSITLPNGGSSRIPMVAPFCTDGTGCSIRLFEVGTPSFVSGNTWNVPVKNADSTSRTVGIACY